jgi:hypothetical protein
MSDTVYFAPNTKFNSIELTIFIGENMTRLALINLLIGANTGQHMNLPGIHVFHCSEYCLTPKGISGKRNRLVVKMGKNSVFIRLMVKDILHNRFREWCCQMVLVCYYCKQLRNWGFLFFVSFVVFYHISIIILSGYLYYLNHSVPFCYVRIKSIMIMITVTDRIRVKLRKSN